MDTDPRCQARRPSDQVSTKPGELQPHLLGGWAYGAIYRDSKTERTAALAGWIDFYNHRRNHTVLSHKPPIARLNELNNPLWDLHLARPTASMRVSSPPGPEHLLRVGHHRRTQ